MSKYASLTRFLLGGSAAAPAPIGDLSIDPPEAGTPTPSPDAGDTVTVAQANQRITAAGEAGIKQGTADANTRWQTVLGDDAAKGKTSSAIMLLADTDLPADKIVAQLGKLAPDADAGASAPAAPSQPASPPNGTADLGKTPPVNLGGSGAGAHDGEPDAKPEKSGAAFWDSIEKEDQANITTGGPGAAIGTRVFHGR